MALGVCLSMETFAEPVFSNDLLAKAENGDTSAQLELAEIIYMVMVLIQMKIKLKSGLLNQQKMEM